MRKRLAQRPVHHYVIATVLLVLMVSLMVMLVGIVKKEEIARHSVEETRRELDSLTARETTLQKNLEDLLTARGQEASIRETYGVARPGEEVIIVVEPPPEAPLQALSWWSRVLGRFGL
jgi:cell division protein FtsB